LTSRADLQAAIADLLEQRGDGNTICPSEAARAVGDTEWRDLMPDAREAAARMADRGEVEVTQKGEVVEVRSARGPVRIRRKRTGETVD
jgi:hypothetical protein